MNPSLLNPPRRILMGPGPSDVPDRVLRALGSTTIGHLDPEYLKLMDEVRTLLKAVFQTKNELTLAVPATGMAGMECCIANLIEPGDKMLVCCNGVFGLRMVDVAERYGAEVIKLETEWGKIFSEKEIKDALEKAGSVKAVGIVHAETSTGAHQPIEKISKVVHDHGALLVLDAVTSLSGIDVQIDGWDVDACYSGTQKCLSCPPGLSPVTFSRRAEEAIDARKKKVQSWYLDLTMVRNYWGDARSYHHTAPVNMTYALREALAIIVEEGLEVRFKRHELNHHALKAGLNALGIEYIPEKTLTTLNCVRIPDGVEDGPARKFLLEKYGLEIGGGLGPFAGKAWRIGLMGHSSSERNVLVCLSALEDVLTNNGVKVPKGKAREEALKIYSTK